MDHVEALQPAIIYLGAGLAAAFASQAVKLSPIVGYLVAGLAIGPFGLGLVEENGTTAFLAELGVVFLLFDIGLHFSIHEIRVRRRDMLGLAPVQMILAGGAFAGVGWLLGWPWETSVIVGVSLALSSTAVVARILADRHAEGGPLGRSATAVLVAQDVAAIFLLVFAASLGEEGKALDVWSVGRMVGYAIASLAVAVLAGRFVVRPLFRSLAQTNNREAFTVVALFIVLAASAATARIGLSLTLGAFLAGMALSDTPYRHVVQHEVKPFQGLLLGLFFMSVGMGVNLPAMAAVWPAVLATAVVVVALKTATMFLAARINRWKTPGAVALGFLLSQGSEFTLVVVAMPAVAGALPDSWSSIILAAVAVTLVAAPFWASLGGRLSRRLVAKGKEAAAPAPLVAPGAVLVFGMTEEGRMAVDALKAHHIPYVAIDSDPERFVAARSEGYDVSYGDARDSRLMEKLGASRARAVVIGGPRLGVNPVHAVSEADGTTPQRFIAVNTSEERAAQKARGLRAHLALAEPRGVELAADLLAQMGVEPPAIAAWLAEQADLRGLEPKAGETAEPSPA
jgi:CPA2 family monovalent cation:H+ antiporter-2